jgi:hypothetical protein
MTTVRAAALRGSGPASESVTLSASVPEVEGIALGLRQTTITVIVWECLRNHHEFVFN